MPFERGHIRARVRYRVVQRAHRPGTVSKAHSDRCASSSMIPSHLLMTSTACDAVGQEIDNDRQPPADATFRLVKSVDVHEHDAVLRSTRRNHVAQAMISAEVQAVGGQAADRGDDCDR